MQDQNLPEHPNASLRAQLAYSQPCSRCTTHAIFCTRASVHVMRHRRGAKQKKSGFKNHINCKKHEQRAVASAYAPVDLLHLLPFCVVFVGRKKKKRKTEKRTRTDTQNALKAKRTRVSVVCFERLRPRPSPYASVAPLFGTLNIRLLARTAPFTTFP